MYGHTLDYLTNTCPYLNANFHCYDYFFLHNKDQILSFFELLNVARRGIRLSLSVLAASINKTKLTQVVIIMNLTLTFFF